MRRILAWTTVGLAVVACSSFGSETADSSGGGPDAAVASASEGGAADGAPSSDGGSPCAASHLFCSDFDDLSLGNWPSSEASSDGLVKLEPRADAAHQGGGGLRVTIPQTSNTLFNHIDADFSGQPGNTITYSLWLRVGTVNASPRSVEIAALVWGGGDAGPPSAIILEHAEGKLHLGYERSSSPVSRTTDLAISPGAWQHVVMTVTMLSGAKPTMTLQVDGQATAGVALTSVTPFVGDLGIELGATYVDAPCPATAYDIDDVTLDAN